MRACVVFNPFACGERARRFRQFLADIGPRAELRPTTGPGTARAIARASVEAGHELVIAAGGDGTVYEVLNGIADVPGGFDHATLGVLPLGTANVLAHELGVPPNPGRAWECLQRAHPRQIDCGLAEFMDHDGAPAHAHFAVVAGAGLDARAVQLVDLRLKRCAGKLAYIAAALRAMVRFPDSVRCTLNGTPFQGRAVLVGNGPFYAGRIPIFSDAALDSGLFHVRGVKSISLGMLVRCLVAYATERWTLEGRLTADRLTDLRLDSEQTVPLQLDGEFAGWLPATLRILPQRLRVLSPANLQSSDQTVRPREG
jgi:YegS/Rv2252/BmrU family lipid kinase